MSNLKNLANAVIDAYAAIPCGPVSPDEFAARRTEDAREWTIAESIGGVEQYDNAAARSQAAMAEREKRRDLDKVKALIGLGVFPDVEPRSISIWSAPMLVPLNDEDFDRGVQLFAEKKAARLAARIAEYAGQYPALHAEYETRLAPAVAALDAAIAALPPTFGQPGRTVLKTVQFCAMYLKTRQSLLRQRRAKADMPGAIGSFAGRFGESLS